MAERKDLFLLMGETSGSIFPLAGEIMPDQFAQHFSEQRFYGPTFLAFQLSPQALTLDLLQQRNLYSNPIVLGEGLVGAAEAGYLDLDGKGGYPISTQGQEAIQTVHRVFYTHINQIGQFPAQKSIELAGLLRKLVAAISSSDLEGGTFCFNCSRGGHPLAEEGTLAEIDQLLDDINAFRDDAHIAAWRPAGVSGQVWETLTMIWNGTAAGAEKLAENLPYRNYAKEEFQGALDQLVKLGWIESSGEVYQLTEEGRKLREKAEEATDLYFFQPWEALSANELDRLGALLGELRDTNKGQL